MNLYRLLPFILILAFFAACGEDEPKSPTYDKQLLIGRWELTDAWRSKRKTETLTGIYYEFDDSKMRTNFTMDMKEQEFAYDFDGQSVLQKGKTERFLYIDSLTQSFLLISTTFNEFPFKLALQKKPPIQSEAETEM